MTDLLGIGASGLSSYRTGLSTIGDNVANANTAGYVRRDVTLGAAATIGGANPLYRDGSAVGGVRVLGVARAADAYKIADARLTAADAARADARARWLATAETQLPDGSKGVAMKLTAVYTAADALAADSEGNLPRQAMLTALDDAASGLRTSADGLARVSAGIGTEAKDLTDRLNASLSALSQLNSTLRRLPEGSSAKAAALDERDRLLDGIAGAVGIDVSFDAAGAVGITAAGASGTTLLDGRGPALVSLAAAEDGRLSLSVERDGAVSALAPSGGSLSGLVDAAASIAGRRRQLDAVAVDFAAQINAWNAGGTTRAGTAGAALLAATGAGDIALATDNPAALAAAKGGSANGNALALAATRGAGGIEARAAALVSGLSQSVAAAKVESASAATRADSSAAARDAGSGVDLDREAAELIRFQQAYDASAKIVQVARETLQSILQLF
ncbi:flagellar hook-associated protein FlgK [Sphingomonas jatrophae]|uniref:Flagellar hook-associated protein 1 n=1 Tax=Sphingomonas jatrophae TaxID=1166337 RepID=A0A1I6MAK5_9SPHN|nr:flagellar hook-associated protein FlgK [Sphingomonas jatrophae]SFS12756.1 flagellar hook-associated protein 1 FlgK [Sphingomonas jatrophae]